MTLKTKALYYIFTNISSTTLQYNNDNCYTIIFGHCINDLKNNGILVHFSKHFINIITIVTLVTSLLRSFYQRQWKQWHFIISFSRTFRQLPRKTQDDLLSATTPLYVQLLLAFHLTTASGIEQLRDVLGLDPSERIDNLYDVNELTNLFK